MKRYLLITGLVILNIAWLQFNCAVVRKTKTTKHYQKFSVHQPVQIDENKLNQDDEVKNIILFIGDGMGVAQVYAGMTANQGKLNLEYLKYIGFSKTQAYDNYLTDSAAGATAIATGVKTYVGAIGVDSDTVKVPNIVELAEAKGLSTGLIATVAVTAATPAAFIAHQKSRDFDEAIALDYLKTDIDVVIGGGLRYFANRTDGQSLIPLLENKGYTVITDEKQLKNNNGNKFIALLADDELSEADERKDFLCTATQSALDQLDKNENGFFLMIEGSQIDWAGHDNETDYVVEEMLDLDKAIGTALEFAANKGQTLIICTADHETGGMTLESGDIATGQIEAKYSTDDHTGVMVPVFSIGPGADEFIGIYENTAIFDKLKSLLNL